MQVAPRMEEMNWSVEECAAPRFATCDRLPATWRTPSEDDRYMGVGIEGADELWLPLDPRNLLVLRHGGRRGPVALQPRRLARLRNA